MKPIKTKWALGECIEGRGELRRATETLNGEYCFIIEKWSASRSLRQNATMWMWLKVIGDELGYTKEQIHEEMIRMFAPKIEITEIDTGEVREVGKRTSAMSKDEMMEYMDEIYRWATGEMGMELPITEDL